MTNVKENPKRVRSNPVRLTFVSLFEKKPKAKGSDKLTYQATLLVPAADIQPFVNAMNAAMQAKLGKVLKLAGRFLPIKKAEDFPYAGYEKGMFVIPAHSDTPPPVVDHAKVPITDRSRVYSGVWAQVVVDAYVWDNSFGTGVSFDLKAVQIVRDDARLDGRGKPVDPDEAFEALEMPDDKGASEAPWDPTK